MVEAVARRGPRQVLSGLPRTIARRLLQAIPTLALVSIAAFSLTLLAPGDPLVSRMDREAVVAMTPEQRAAARADLGLDDPLPLQYAKWLGRAATGDFGYSIISGRPAITEVADRLGPTLILMGGAIVVAVGVGVPIGVIAARNQGRLADRMLSGAVVTLVATPPFVLGLLLIFLLAIQWRIFPAGGMGVAGEPLTLPMLLRPPHPARGRARAGQRGTARALHPFVDDRGPLVRLHPHRALDGGTRGRVVRHHGYRNASLPIITLIAVLITELLAVAVVTEEVFAWPGLGTLIIRSAQSSDAPVLMVVVLLVAMTTIVVNLLADVLYSLVDPRVRL